MTRTKEPPGTPTKCRSCSADIIWVVTSSGKKMPCNVLSDPNGKFYLFRTADRIEAVHVNGTDARVARALARGDRTFESHFTTCPAAEHHRKGRRR